MIVWFTYPSDSHITSRRIRTNTTRSELRSLAKSFKIFKTNFGRLVMNEWVLLSRKRIWFPRKLIADCQGSGGLTGGFQQLKRSSSDRALWHCLAHKQLSLNAAADAANPTPTLQQAQHATSGVRPRPASPRERPSGYPHRRLGAHFPHRLFYKS